MSRSLPLLRSHPIQSREIQRDGGLRLEGPWRTETGLGSRDLKEKELARSSGRSCQREPISSTAPEKWRAEGEGDEEEKRHERPPVATGFEHEDGGGGRGLKSLSGEP